MQLFIIAAAFLKVKRNLAKVAANAPLRMARRLKVSKVISPQDFELISKSERYDQTVLLVYFVYQQLSKGHKLSSLINNELIEEKCLLDLKPRK